MRSDALRKLEPGSFVMVKFEAELEPETARFRELRGPTERELHYGMTQNVVEVRRFLLGGYIDTAVALRYVVEPTEPDAGLLAMIEYCENTTGPKPKRKALSG